MQNYGDVQGVEKRCVVQSAQCRERYHDAALHVGRSRALRDMGIDALEFLQWTRRLEHGVQMSDEQHMRTVAFAFGDQMAGACETLATHPACFEAQCPELGREQIADRTHAGEIHRTAIDVHRLFEQPHGIVLLALYALDETALDARRRRKGDGGNYAGEQREDSPMTRHHEGVRLFRKTMHDT